MKKTIFLVLLGLLSSVGMVWGAGTALSSLNFSAPASLPANYTYSSTNTPSATSNIGPSGDKRACVLLTNGGGGQTPTINDASVATGDGKRWMAFCPAVDCSVEIVVYNTKNFFIFDKDNYIAKESANSNNFSKYLDKYTPANNTAWYTWTIEGLKADKWYVLSGGGSQCYIYSMQFTAAAADVTAPTLSSSVPANSATGVATSGTIVLTFSEAIASVDSSKFSISGATKGAVAIDGSDSKKVNVPYSGAAISSTVTLSVAANAVADAAGNKSATLSNIAFTTTATATYPVTYDLNYDGAGAAPTETNKAAGATVTLAAAPYRDCYTFAGWRCNIDDVTYDAEAEYTMTAANTTFTAQWTANYASGTFNFEGKTVTASESAATVVDGKLYFSAVKAELDTKDNDYLGWKLKTSGATVKFMVENNSEVKVTLKEKSPLNVTYTPLVGAQTTETAGKSATKTVNVKGGTIVTLTTTTATTTTLNKIEIKNIYTVTYEGNGSTGGEVPSDGSSPYVSGSTVTVLGNTGDLVKTGYGFAGWNTQADGKGTSYAPDATFTISANTTLYAKWAETFTVTYKANGSGEDDIEDDDATLVADNPFTYSGHEFTGWNTEDDGTGIAYAVGATVSSNLDLFAQWAELYTITKGDHDNGDFTISKNPAIAGDEITLTATPDEDYLFSAWDVYKTGESSTKVTVTSNTFTMPAYAVTVAATFVADERDKVLYVTKNDEATTKSSDKLYAALKDAYNVKIVGPTSEETLTNYNLVVLHESVDGSSYNATAVLAAKTTSVPVLNTKSYFYNEGRWGWGTPNAGKSVKGATQNSAFSNIASHPIFTDVTVTDGFFDITAEAAEKCMQPIGSFTTGYEGYILAKTPNSDSGNGAAIHEIPAGTARGASSGKYLLISVSGSKLSDLNANGQKLFQNAAAYLIGVSSWTPTISATITSAGWATFCSSYALDFTGGVSDITVYTVNGLKPNGVTLNIEEVTTHVPANTGLLIEGSAGTYNIPVVASSNTDLTNDLVAVTADDTDVEAAATGYTNYVLCKQNGKVVFAPIGATKATLNKGQAYLQIATGELGAPSVIRLVDDENNATSVENIESAEQVHKFFQNGQLFILREGVTYDALGRIFK